MGKSPGKWLRSLLPGKKSSKSGTSKKSSNEKESVISTNAALSGSSVHLPLISEPVAVNAGGIKEDPNFEKGGVTNEVIIPSIERDGDEQNTCLTLPEDTEKMRLEQAATKAQAIVRGYLDAKQLDYQRTNASKLARELSKNEFTTKLLASSLTVMPLHLHYGPEEPNSSQEWLVRWTISQIWQPQPKSETLSRKKHQNVEADIAMSKHSVRKVHSRKMQNGSNHSTSSGSEKKKSSHLVNSVLQNPGSEIKKVKHTVKKMSNPLLEKPIQSEVDTERKRQSHDKLSSMTSDEPLQNSEGIVENSTNVAPSQETLVVDDTISRLDILSVSDTLHKSTTDAAGQKPITDNQEDDTPVANEDSCTNHDNNEGNESNKVNRRVSLPAKHDVDASTPTTPTTRKVPSYMAPTKSAKAKLKEQASPRFGQDVAEKNAVTRRHSLPSPMNGKLSSSPSPRVQRLVQASAKEGIKIDRSLSSSRDGTDKMTRAEWKR